MPYRPNRVIQPTCTMVIKNVYNSLIHLQVVLQEIYMKFIHLLLSNLIGQNVQAMVQDNLQVVYDTCFDQSDHSE